MTIEYAIWQGTRLLSVGNTATDIKEIDKVIETLNDSEIAKKNKFSANIMKLEVK
jgi:hypothetical protein